MIAASAGLGAQQQGVSFRSARRTAAAARGRLVVQAGLPPSGSKLTAGQKVTVKESIKIWHAPDAAVPGCAAERLRPVCRCDNDTSVGVTRLVQPLC